MHPIWKGAISFGLVHIPIKLYPATGREDIKFNYLHQKDNTPIKYKRYCPTCNADVPNEEIVKGYEHESGKYVVLTDDEFGNIPVENSKTISIIDFVNLPEVDPVYFEKSYYLVPNEGGQKAYELLRKSMETTGKAAIAKVVLRSKEMLSAVRVYKNTIMMETMFYHDEIRATAGFSELNYNVKLHDNEIKMAESLISSLAEEFKPEKYNNEYRQAIMEIIQSKITGKEIAVPEKPDVTNVIDLMEALKASIKLAKEEKSVPAGTTGDGEEIGKKGRKTS